MAAEVGGVAGSVSVLNGQPSLLSLSTMYYKRFLPEFIIKII